MTWIKVYKLSTRLNAVFSSIYLCGINLALNDVENGDVAVVIFSISQG